MSEIREGQVIFVIDEFSFFFSICHDTLVGEKMYRRRGVTFFSLHIENLYFTYLAERKLFKESIALVGLAENEILVDLHLSPGILGRDQGFVSPEIFRIRVKSLKKIVPLLDRS